MDIDTKNKILDFIKHRFRIDCNWLNGNCLYFAKILTWRFPELSIYYLPKHAHFVAGNGVKFFDFTGIVSSKIINEDNPQSIEDMKSRNISLYNRLMKDCFE